MSEDYKGNKTDFYLASTETAEVVNLAIDLKRPLLVEGEPGCGKTMLAYSISAELGLGEVTKIPVKSTSRAQDLLYRIDALRRLQDAQDPKNKQARYTYPYLRMGSLGEAIRRNHRRVVLIDEVDKADIDFPNDLLDVFDRFQFEIDELPVDEEELCRKDKGFGRVIGSPDGVRPIVVITSNREKRLPEPFLRRCLYIRLMFPQTLKELGDIIRKNTKLSSQQLSDNLLQAAVEAFQRVREVAVREKLEKAPTTGELIDWVRILYWRGEKPEDVARHPQFPPKWELLFKTMNDLSTYPAVAEPKK
jgi:MoxR-like ATPase